MSRAIIPVTKRPASGLFSLRVAARKWGLPPPGNLTRAKRLVGGRFALKFEFCRDAGHSFDPINKTRQARNGARPSANGAVALIQFSRFSARRDRPVWAGCSDYPICVFLRRYSQESPRGSEESVGVAFCVKCEPSVIKPLGFIGVFRIVAFIKCAACFRSRQ